MPASSAEAHSRSRLPRPLVRRDTSVLAANLLSMKWDVRSELRRRTIWMDGRRSRRFTRMDSDSSATVVSETARACRSDFAKSRHLFGPTPIIPSELRRRTSRSARRAGEAGKGEYRVCRSRLSGTPSGRWTIRPPNPLKMGWERNAVPVGRRHTRTGHTVDEIISGYAAQGFHSVQPSGDVVPTGARLVHHPSLACSCERATDGKPSELTSPTGEGWCPPKRTARRRASR
jgi:hypothetical protein